MSLDMQQTGYSLRTEQMKIMVSACLIGEKCKYNGKDNYSKELEQFIKGHEVIAVCPEVTGGLTVPRRPCEIVNGMVINKDRFRPLSGLIRHIFEFPAHRAGSV